MRHAFYSTEAAAKYGTAFWVDGNGDDVEVTAVYPGIEEGEREYRYPDKRYVGPVESYSRPGSPGWVHVGAASNMTLNAADLTRLQRCARLPVLERSEKQARWHPKSLFDFILRNAILNRSRGNGAAVIEQFLGQCKNPGLDTPRDPWTLAHDYTAMLQTIMEAVSREPLPVLHAMPPVEIPGQFHDRPGGSKGLLYQPLACQDDTGQLHRWATVHSLDEDSLSAELHSWYVSGDMLATGLPMQLHLIEIGHQRNGHVHSPWCRCYKHPAIAYRYAFQQRDGSKLQGGWKAMWYQDSQDNDPKVWVNLMERDNVKLIHHKSLRQPGDKRRAEFLKHVGMEAERLSALPADVREIPMFRPACDKPFVCPWQWKCYGAEG